MHNLHFNRGNIMYATFARTLTKEWVMKRVDNLYAQNTEKLGGHTALFT
jgi:hypothetical protein